MSKQLLWGNVSLIACFAFYLAWWIAAFNPIKAYRGFQSGWLLIPAVILGVASLALLVPALAKMHETVTAAQSSAVQAAKAAPTLFSPFAALIAGAAAYALLLAVTVLCFHRAVTTELFLIVAWTTLVCIEVSICFEAGLLGGGVALLFIVCTIAAAVISIVCYLLFYQLDKTPAFICGAIPLVLSEFILLALLKLAA